MIENRNVGLEILEVLKEILKWTKFQAWSRVKDTLLTELQDKKSILVYHLSDGKSSREIAKKVGITHPTVLNYWKKWSRIPLVEPIVVGGKVRYRKMFELEDFGIEIPNMQKKEVKSNVK